MLALLAGITNFDIEREFPAKGRADLYLPRFRAVIEAKKSTGAGPRPGELPTVMAGAQQQMEDYLRVLARREREQLNFSGTPLSQEHWVGMISDGMHWKCWTYRADADEYHAVGQLEFALGPGTAPADLLDKLSAVLKPDPLAKTWIPADPSQIFEGCPEALEELWGRIPSGSQKSTRTKLALWRDMLAVSGLSPKGRAASPELFALHSFLIATARFVTHLLSPSGGHGNWRDSLMDGFASWILDWEGGEQWADRLWETVQSYDWRSRQGDVLRVLYESFVPKVDRKIFGEVYTPDWLAGMMVEQALDADWLERSVVTAGVALRSNAPLEGVGVLDPACGSGTFLYHAALQIVSEAGRQGLSRQGQTDVATLLLNGIDIHPVAVEVAKATVLRALPTRPLGGVAAIRIHMGDSLLTDEDRSKIFGHREGAMRVQTQRSEFFVPMGLVRRDTFADDMRRIVFAAATGRPVPADLLHEVEDSLREDLEECRDALEATIRDEGNSVWTWYAVNRAAPHLLEGRKVDRIVANPPWVKLANIQEEGRKNAMENMGKELGLQAGGKQAPHLDIATFFPIRARHLYMTDPQGDPAVWLVKRSALNAGHWASFRNVHDKHLTQSVDLLDVQPFGGGDAKRCCLLAEHTRFSAYDGRENEKTLEATAAPKQRPKPEESWSAVRGQVRLAPARPLPPQVRSDYAPRLFRQGATVVPHTLVLVASASPQMGRRVLVETVPSKQPPWRTIRPEAVDLPFRWLVTLIRSENLFPMAISADEECVQAIIPVDESGDLALESAMDEPGWQYLNHLYERHCGIGGSTPKTLCGRLDYGRSLSCQPRHSLPDRRMLLYPASGDIMRAARSAGGEQFIDAKLYWWIADSEDEAGYLAALLNAPCLRRAFLESRTSGRDFHKNPWKKVPIPRFDVGDTRHEKLARLCTEAEQVAQPVYDRLAGANQVKLSRAIRAQLVRTGIVGRLNELAAELLPNQAEV